MTSFDIKAVPGSELLFRKTAEISEHPVFSSVRTIEDLRMFMEWHVFAVWDFMSLAKRLQCEITCIDLPWVPPEYPKAARLINEIVLGEESDEGINGGHLSHFEIYLRAMTEVGASTSQVLSFVNYIRNGVSVDDSLNMVGAHPAIRQFVGETLETAQNKSLIAVLGSFFYGREDIIPHMFTSLLEQWNIEPESAPTFVYYLKRHIELDGDEHGPAAQKMIGELLDGNPHGWTELVSHACEAIDSRGALWDAMAIVLNSQRAEMKMPGLVAQL